MKLRVLIAKPGLDGHDRGAKIVARALRDAGFEVIYTGLHKTPREIVQACVQEDADVVGLSILSGAHLSLTARIVAELRAAGKSETVLLVGGIVPEDDRGKLKDMGVAAVFGPGTSTQTIVQFLEEHARTRFSSQAGEEKDGKAESKT